MVYAVYRCGFFPVSALGADNALQNRIDKITGMIGQCKYGIHDISRTESNTAGYPRFNMPFELGLFYAAGKFGSGNQKQKNGIVFEKVKYTYQQYLSDINGIDTRAHDNDPEKVIRHIRTWLMAASRRKTIPGPAIIQNDFSDFFAQLSMAAIPLGFSGIDDIPFLDYCLMVEEAVRG